MVTPRRSIAYFNPVDGHYYRYHTLDRCYYCYDHRMRVSKLSVIRANPLPACGVLLGNEHTHDPLTRLDAELIYLRWRSTLILMGDPWDHIPNSAMRLVLSSHSRSWVASMPSPESLGKRWKNYFYQVVELSRAPTEAVRRYLELSGPVQCDAYLQVISCEWEYFSALPPLRPVGMYLFFLSLCRSFELSSCFLFVCSGLDPYRRFFFDADGQPFIRPDPSVRLTSYGAGLRRSTRDDSSSDDDSLYGLASSEFIPVRPRVVAQVPPSSSSDEDVGPPSGEISLVPGWRVRVPRSLSSGSGGGGLVPCLPLLMLVFLRLLPVSLLPVSRILVSLFVSDQLFSAFLISVFVFPYDWRFFFRSSCQAFISPCPGSSLVCG